MMEDKYEMANKGINKTAEFFVSLGMPTKLKEVGIDEENITKMAVKCEKRLALGYVPLNSKEIEEVFKNAL